jgi:Mn2+/Fe2+ NRAMP family transporter
MRDPTAFEGLPMVRPPDPAALEREKRMLAELDTKGTWERTAAYLRQIGPGYLQSAMTLGSGTAAASLFAGAAFGYTLLWVPPVAMLLGIIMLSAVAHQTLSTGLRPFEAMRRYAGPFFAYGWAIGALVASIIWHFPQYAMASTALVDMGAFMGVSLNSSLMGVVVLVWAVATAMMYGQSPKWIRAFERLLKYMVWLVIVCFALVVIRTGIPDVGALLRGFFTFQIPGEHNGVHGATVMLGGLSAAVGVNMVFLYPYSLLTRGWGREHRRLARFDLFTGMFIPYVIAASLMIIATANTLHVDGDFAGKLLLPKKAAESLEPSVGPTIARIVFNLGILAMALSTITLQMLCSGFACSEMFNWKVGSTKYRIATLLPTPGVLGAVYWGDMAMWVAVPIALLCGFLLPIAYVGFIILHRRQAYLGDDTPSGPKGIAWIGGMLLATGILIVYLGWYAITKGPQFISAFRQLE